MKALSKTDISILFMFSLFKCHLAQKRNILENIVMFEDINLIESNLYLRDNSTNNEIIPDINIQNTTNSFRSKMNHSDPGDQVEFVTYTVAVLEYEPFSDWSQGGEVIVQKNAHVFAMYAARAKQQGADLLVLPEYGLTSTDLGLDQYDLFTMAQIVPDPEDLVTPCALEKQDNMKALHLLSCTASQLQMYLIVDLAEVVLCSGNNLEKAISFGNHNTSVFTFDEMSSSDNIDTHKINDNGSFLTNKILNSLPLAKMKFENESMSQTTDTQTGNQKPKNICPTTGYYFYNTQVVFDRNGTVITRYRKKHLFLEPEFVMGEENDSMALFTTDFGITFSLQICFDIMYKEPGLNNLIRYHSNDVVMSTAWIDELPFLTAPQIFMGWSRGLEVNLLVANYHKPEAGMMGSGIFRMISSENPDYIYDTDNGTTLVVGNVTSLKSGMLSNRRRNTFTQKNVLKEFMGNEDYESDILSTNSLLTKNSEQRESNNNVKEIFNEEQISSSGLRYHFIIHENISQYSSLVLNPRYEEMQVQQLCHNDNLCCTVTFMYSSNSSIEGTFMLLAYSGSVTKGGWVYEMFIQVCAVVYCLTENKSTCASFNQDNFYVTNNIVSNEPPISQNILNKSSFQPKQLTGTFSTPYIYPSLLSQYLQLYGVQSWQYISTDLENSVINGTINVTEELAKLLSLTLFGRWYERDP